MEIGPGPGILTRPLAADGRRVRALEIDHRLARVARELAPAAEVLDGDAMTADLAALLGDLPVPRALVSNLPYYITHPLVERILAARANWSFAVLMMQREVALKWLARPGQRERGSFSVYLQAVCEVRRVADVPASAFVPPPRVDSVVLELIPRAGSEWPEDLEKLVRTGFKQPRKTLANNLKGSPWEGRVDAVGLDPLVRPHDLSEEQWRSLVLDP